MSEDDDLLIVLKDIRRWVKLLGLEEARSKLRAALEDDDTNKETENQIIYHLTNGENSSREIAKFVSVGRRTVSNRHDQWAKEGLVEKVVESGFYQKLIALEEAGISTPEIREKEEESEDDD